MEPLRLPARGLVFDAPVGGPTAGELAVLLHGFPQTSACWTRVLATLAAAGYRAVAPDQHGYSPTGRPTTIQAYRMSELVADVLAIANRLGVDTFHLVGLDWPNGGVVGGAGLVPTGRWVTGAHRFEVLLAPATGCPSTTPGSWVGCCRSTWGGGTPGRQIQEGGPADAERDQARQ